MSLGLTLLVCPFFPRATLTHTDILPLQMRMTEHSSWNAHGLLQNRLWDTRNMVDRREAVVEEGIGMVVGVDEEVVVGAAGVGDVVDVVVGTGIVTTTVTRRRRRQPPMGVMKRPVRRGSVRWNPMVGRMLV